MEVYEAAADLLNAALKGRADGSAEDVLIEVFSSHQPKELQRIAEFMDTKYDKTLTDLITAETYGHFERLLLDLLQDRALVDAKALYYNLRGLGSDDDIMLEVLTARTVEHIRNVVDAYENLYHRSLHKDVEADTSGEHQRMLINLLYGAQSQETFFDASRLLNSRGGGPDAELVELLATQSQNQIEALVGAYAEVSPDGVTLRNALESGKGGDFARLLVAIVTPGDFVADRMQHAIETMATDDELLMRLLTCTPTQVLRVTREAYLKKFHRSVLGDIFTATVGSHRKMLMMLLLRDPEDRRLMLLRQAIEDPIKNEEFLCTVLTCCMEKGDLVDLSERYRKEFGVTLQEDITEVFDRPFRDFLLGVFAPGPSRRVHDAFNTPSKREAALIEVFSSRTADELIRLQSDYESTYRTSLVTRVKDELHGSVADVLLQVLVGRGTGTTTMDAATAASAARELHDAAGGAAEGAFVDVFMRFTSPQLQAIGVEYKSLYGSTLAAAVRDELSGDLEMLLLACLQPERHAAQMLYRACRGLATSDDTLVHLITSRGKPELADLAAAFNDQYSEPFVPFVTGSVGGAYRRAMEAYLVPNTDLIDKWGMVLMLHRK